jgi:hypothetical protein
MATASEYHQYARECLESADRATSENDRKQFINMARAWTVAALQLEPSKATDTASSDVTH